MRHGEWRSLWKPPLVSTFTILTFWEHPLHCSTVKTEVQSASILPNYSFSHSLAILMKSLN